MTNETAALESILEYVESELAFASSHYNDSYLDRRVSSRVRRADVGGYEDYLELLRTDLDEQEALLDALSINVTGFFRNPDVWEGIRDVLRTLSDDRKRGRIRAWSAACADGREPYSLSILAHADPAIDESAVHVLATDISETALQTAREGVYEDTRTTDIDDQLSVLKDYERFVDRSGDTFRVRDRVKRSVTFERHDLINDDPKSDFDLIICRNLFIYIDNEYKTPMLETIADSLRPGGYLVIGKSETIPPSLTSVFSVCDGRLRIYRREPTGS
ncbi:CheR family methyltransferase [Natrialbaceae archaeon AArc-T1-2]|uniref:CheR family methyltransferase n=1 Tax=Natrialbaceae archaeon AArc-T1-2 TaxID=3053904 RepID=UPI00255A86E8|nr:protein-glutamate O-methyltransferase CheR [Natrialbaceae archaeon AArc-T1-2]WIV67936.1 protein-glutamate O-methyltransferase CheR [Natrialbaceae archaeon AArc-T1-2]